jgi:hypothetical protein
MNEAPRKIRNKLRALAVDPSDFALDLPYQAVTIFSRRLFTVALELAEASVQTIEFRPIKIIHFSHLGAGPASICHCLEFNGYILKESENCS